MYKPEKLPTLGTQDEDKKNKNKKTTEIKKEEQQRNVGHHYAQLYAKRTIKHESSYKQLEARENQTSLLCGNLNGHHIRAQRA